MHPDQWWLERRTITETARVAIAAAYARLRKAAAGLPGHGFRRSGPDLPQPVPSRGSGGESLRATLRMTFRTATAPGKFDG